MALTLPLQRNNKRRKSHEQKNCNRFEGTYAICEDKDQKFFAIEIAELPQGAKEGHVIEIKDDGTLSIDQKETDLRREKNKKLQNSLWK